MKVRQDMVFQYDIKLLGIYCVYTLYNDKYINDDNNETNGYW